MRLEPKTRQQIATEYHIDRKTLYRWLKLHQIELPAGLIYPKHVAHIYEVFGDPREQPALGREDRRY